MLAALTTLAADYTYSAPTTTPDTATSVAAYGMVFIIFFIISLPVVILRFIGLWKMLTKAGRPGWASLIPGYNFLQIVWMTGRPWWWILLLMIPLVNIVVIVMIYNDLSKSFGRGVGTTLLFIFIPVIGYLIVGLGTSECKGPVFQQTVGGVTPPDASTPHDTTPSDAGAPPEPPVKPAV